MGLIINTKTTKQKRSLKMKKIELKDRIRDAVQKDTKFGDDFVCMADVWIDAVEKKLNHLTKKELSEYYHKVKELGLED
jgi:hypothetical protein